MSRPWKTDNGNVYNSISTWVKTCLDRFVSVMVILGKYNVLSGERIYVSAGHR